MDFDSHFAPYLPCFQSLTRSVDGSARLYLHGLFQCRRRNMEKMAETVSGSRYQRLHHMLSESAWDRGGVRRQLIRDANAHFGHACALVIDESAFAKKGEMALAMIHRLRREGLRFAYTVFDAGYGHLPWLLRALDGERETFLAEVHSDQAIYLADQAPAVPDRSSGRGKAPSRLQAQTQSLTVTDWAHAQEPSRWRRLSVREGEKGEVVADYLKQRVWLWDGAEQWARCWHHHMALVMVALMFLAKERLAHRDTGNLLSCNDLVEIMRHKLPTKIETDSDLVAMIEDRHQRRRVAMDHAYRKQTLMLAASACG